MIYIGMSFLLYGLGVIFFILRVAIMPFEQLLYGFEYIALMLMGCPIFILLYGLSSKKLLGFLERTPANKMLILFLRRDGNVVPVTGVRAYPGESFIDVPKLGLIHDLGNVYRMPGGNSIRFALENVNHTADPGYANFNQWLYDIGFNNISEVQATLKGEFKEQKDKVIERIPLFNADAVDVLVDELGTRKTK